MVRFSTAFYGLDRNGRWTVMVCKEWIEPDAGRSGSVTDRFIEADDEADAKKKAYGAGATFVKSLS